MSVLKLTYITLLSFVSDVNLKKKKVFLIDHLTIFKRTTTGRTH